MNTEPANRIESESSAYLSIGIIAWNEETAIRSLLETVFQQTLFADLHKRQLHCEIHCVANGCTDRTVEAATEIFAEQKRTHPHAAAFRCRVVDLKERGKINAWNEFVHTASAREAEFLTLMDADIVIHNPDTLLSLLRTLETYREAKIAVDTPCKDIEFKSRLTAPERMSLAMSRLTRSASAQLCAQLYCIRAETARNIYLPKDLTACDDGFIKTLVCTDFLAHAVWPMRIQIARNASHTFEAYVSLPGVFKNQKRQAIGQTLVHLLVDDYLKRLPMWERNRLAETLRRKDRDNPDWLKQLVRDHLRRKRFFWRLYPGLLSHRFNRLSHFRGWKRIAYFPAALAGSMVSVFASFAAYRFLKSGGTGYWPRVNRGPLQTLNLPGEALSSFTHLKTQ